MHSFNRHCTYKILPGMIRLFAAVVLSTAVLTPSIQHVSAATGDDRSTQGCIGSAGYTWSALRQECVRLFEVGVPLYNAEDPGATSVAYVISGGSTEPLELFLPGQPDGFLMFFRDGAWHDDDGRYALTNSADDVLNLRDATGKLLYSSLKTT